MITSDITAHQPKAVPRVWDVRQNPGSALQQGASARTSKIRGGLSSTAVRGSLETCISTVGTPYSIATRRRVGVVLLFSLPSALGTWRRPCLTSQQFQPVLRVYSQEARQNPSFAPFVQEFKSSRRSRTTAMFAPPRPPTTHHLHPPHI